jgi:DNA uptake protein ComE-like DNA-binding protein
MLRQDEATEPGRKGMRFISIVVAFTGLLATSALHAQVGTNQNLADPNLADPPMLRSLPHVSEALANAIVAARPFTSAAALNEVIAKSLDEAQRAELYGRLFRQINLNTASREEIMLIPGMTGRMAREFEEYRPYTSLEQFRREIGKYVDEKEVARLEQYVFVPLNLNTASAEDFQTIPGMTRRMVREFEEYRPYQSMEQFRKEIGKYVDEKEVARLESYVTLE